MLIKQRVLTVKTVLICHD